MKIKSPQNPELKYFPHQEEMIGNMLKADTQGLIYNACAMGVGKTIIALGYALNLNIRNLLIICPASLRLNWQKEIKWLDKKPSDAIPLLAGNDHKKIPTCDSSSSSIIITSYDLLANDNIFSKLTDRVWDLVICDESHMIRTIKAIRTQKTLELLNNNAERFQLLTGTPILNSALDLFPALYSIIPYQTYINKEDYLTCTNYFAFLDKYTYRVKLKQNIVQYKGVKNHEDLKDLLKNRGKFFFRKTKEDIELNLPSKTYSIVPFNINVPLELDQVTISKVLNIYMNKHKYKEGLDEEMKKHISSMRKSIGEKKALSKEIFEYVSLILEQTPVVLFAFHKSVIAILMDLFKKYKPVKLDGSLTTKEKQASIDKFQNGESDVFIGQLHAAGVGITLTRASYVVFYEIDWLPAIMEQALDRLHRIGQKNAVTAIYPLTDNKFDQSMIKLMVKKQKVISKVY